MDFITYLKRVIDDFKNIGNEKKESDDLKNAKSEYAKYLKEYESQPPEQKYERLELDSTSDEELESAAKQEYEEWLKNKSDSIESSYRNKTEKEEIKRIDAINELNQKEINLEKDLLKDKQKDRNDSVKRGIARSSIAGLKSEQLDKQKDESSEALRQNFLNESSKIDKNIGILQEERNAAINNLDYEYAKEIDAKVAKLIAQRDSNNEKATKYNNQLSQTEAKEQSAKIEQYKSKDLYVLAEKLLSKMSYTDAKAFLASDELKNSLSGYHYYSLYQKYA